MANYSETIIYKIQHETQANLVYVGHTTNFLKRTADHKTNCKSHPKRLYQQIRDNGGWEAFRMVQIMVFPCDSKVQACIQEEKCRVELNASLNAKKAYTTPEEEKLRAADYKEANRDHANEVNKVWYQNNKEKRKAYRESIAEEQKVYKKDWYEANREKLGERNSQVCECKCGKSYTFCNRARHEKSKFHIDNSK